MEVEMPNLIHSITVTADGCCDHTEVIADDDLHHYAANLLNDGDSLLFGRITYQLFESYWPSMAKKGSSAQIAVDFARALDTKPKYVVSSKLEKVQWKNTFLLKGDLAQEISMLKQQDGKNLLMFGSPGLAAALVELGQIDEYHLLVQPILAGRGPRLFQSIGRLDLNLAETRRFASGVVLLR
jgi:dihydrofolate reductase